MHGIQGLPGTIAPDELQSRDEWVATGEGFTRSLAARLGSETSVEKLVLAALPPLAHHVGADTWEALLEELPWELRPMVRSASAHLGGPVPRLTTAREYVAFVARHTQHPDERAALYVGSVLGAMRDALPSALASALAGELPDELAALWRGAP